ncbi:MAG: hypothetical protein LBL46_00850 [Rickettsiales bacterium]|jgi:hypothetical protein|nr:hypothetical protein [Rickettsiales bacterium]
MAATKKKTTKKAAVKKPVAAVKATPAMAAAVSTSKAAKKGVCWKKIIIFVLGIVVGAAGCCLLHCGHKKFGKKFPHPEFTAAGCLDTSKINCPEMLEKIQLKDADKNGCITKDEFFGGKKFGPDAGRQDGDRPARKMRRPRPVAN